MYQHFVPQFLLRNFSHPFVDGESNESKVKKRRKKAKHPKEKPFPGDPVVHSAALSEDPIKLVETTVKRILGQMDMYRDTSQPLPTQNHIEDMFSQMESRVSTIFRKITKAYDAGDPGLWLTRKERNDVRKFLFLLKYRGSGFHRRFDHPTPEEYDEDDKELFQEYMSQKGFTRPISVWFDNLKSIMELEMDAAGEWMDKIRRKIYHADAEWFIMHTQSFYMAICTPEDPLDEFVITDGCYNVFEGRNCYANDAGTGQVDPVAYINLHEFAPISPKLMIVLRSFVFPLPDEDANPETKEAREDARARAVNNIFGPETLENSLLCDLPIKKARNSYSASVNGRLRFVAGEDGTHKLSHKFLFNFFHIKQTHVHKINGVFFDNAFTCSRIVFASRDSFLRSLEWYMTAAPEVIGKKVTLTDGGQRLHYLRKLDALMKALGSNKKSVWDDTPLEGLYDREFHRLWMTYIARETQKVTNDPSMPLNSLLSTYFILGICRSSFMPGELTFS